MNFAEFLTNLTSQYNAIIRRAASDLNLSTSQAFHLLTIPTNGITMSKLAQKLGLDTSTLTRNIQKLEIMGLIKRESDPYDKRVQMTVLTNSGINIAEALEEKLNQHNYLILNKIDLDTQQNMTDLLEKLVWAIDCYRQD